MSDTTRLTASMIVPGDGRVLAPGTLEITDGVVSALISGRDADAVELDGIALIPGLVNPHTHLEFSQLRHPIPADSGMAEWIGQVTQSRRARQACSSESTDPRQDLGNPIRCGIDELMDAGTSLVGDIITSDELVGSWAETDPDCVLFREIIALREDRCDDAYRVACEFLARTTTPPGCAALSPHAPYSVHPDLFHRLVKLASDEKVPLATHLAESPQELELLTTGRGPLRDRLEAFDAWDSSAIPRGSSPHDYLVPLATLDHPLVIHGNFLDERSQSWLADHPHVTVVYCPRTHAHFGHPPHPWRQLRDRGVRVAVGTDSRASNPDLSSFRELQFLARLAPDAPPSQLLQMATTIPAESLGRASQHGQLTPGRTANALGIAIPVSRPVTLRTLLRHGTPVGHMRRGAWKAMDAA